MTRSDGEVSITTGAGSAGLMKTDASVAAALSVATHRRHEAAREVLHTLAGLGAVTFTGFLKQRAQQWPLREALLHKARRWTYSELFSAVADRARQLRGSGVRAGTAVALLMENSDHYVIWYLAVLELSAVAVPLNNRMVPREIGFILENSDARLIVSEHGFDTVLSQLDRAPAGLLIDPATGHGERRPGTSEPGGPTHEHPAALEAARAALTDPADAPAALYYTSGTTGSPKGVVHTHRTLIADSLQSPPAWEYDFDGVRALAVTPLFHIAAHTIFLPVLAVGGTLAIDTYRTDDTIALIGSLGINSFFGVPSILLMMADRARELGTTLPGVRALQFGAAPMPVAKLAQVRELFTQASFVHGMGQTESGGTLVTLPGTLAFERAGSVGFAMAGVDIAIFDETDHEVAHGTVGELVARGPNVMRAYFRNARATAETLRNGWLHTGDLGYRDADGLVYLVDRKKDMIIRGGENIYSTEVEQILMRHPAVAQAAVIGTPDPLFGEQVTAFIVPHAGAAPLTLAQIQSHCRGLLAAYKVPAALHLVDAMPSTATGKVQKGELRALASSR